MTAAVALQSPRVLADVLPGTRVRDASLVAGGALLTAGLAQVVVPMAPVPITGQTLAVGLVGATLGVRRGTLAMLLYVLMGFVLPVYAGGESGVATLWGATGGYLVGFVLATAAIGWMAERGADRRVALAVGAFIVAQVLVFVPGVLVLQMVTGVSWAEAIHSGFTVFLLGGVVKALIGGLALPSTWSVVRRISGRSAG